MTTIEPEPEKRFRRAIERAKKEGVDVDEYFVSIKERVALAYVRCFGLAMSIVAVFYAPKYILDLKIACLREHLDVKIPEDLVYWICALGFVSILAFGFDLVDPRSLTKIWPKKDEDEDPHYEDYRPSDKFQRLTINRSDLFPMLQDRLDDDDNEEGTDGSA